MSQSLVAAALELRDKLDRLRFGPPVEVVYNPLQYAWACHEAYLQTYARTQRRVLFLGMNPGPFGMVQTGVAFGQIAAVRDWLGLRGAIHQPKQQHPKRPVTGFDCPRSEISGQRLWGLFADRFGTPARFFAEHLVVNYCPLAFVEASGRNRTPDKLGSKERESLFALCDEHLRQMVGTLRPEWLIGVGDFAWKRATEVFAEESLKVGRILHPSPASPAANRDWAGLATRQLETLGVWD